MSSGEATVHDRSGCSTSRVNSKSLPDVVFRTVVSDAMFKVSFVVPLDHFLIVGSVKAFRTPMGSLIPPKSSDFRTLEAPLSLPVLLVQVRFHEWLTSPTMGVIVETWLSGYPKSRDHNGECTAQKFRIKGKSRSRKTLTYTFE